MPAGRRSTGSGTLFRETERLRSTWVHPGILPAEVSTRHLGKPIEHEHSLADLLRRPGVSFDAVCAIAAAARPQELIRETTGRRVGRGIGR